MEMNGAETWMVHVCGFSDCGPTDALLRLSPPLIPLASFRHERDLVFAFADGAG
jgi:hypothetical protein